MTRIEKAVVTRRALLRGIALSASGLVLAACQPQVVEKIVEVEKVVTEEVEKVVTEEVEKVVTQVVTPTPSDEVVTLRVQSSRLSEAETRAVWHAWFDAYEEQNPGIKIEAEPVPHEQYLDKIITETIGGNPPEIVTLGVDHLPAMVTAGHMTDLTPFYDREGPDFANALFEGALDGAEYEGSYYAVQSETNHFGAYLYNQGMFEEAGLDPEDPPATWAAFLDAAQKLTTDGRYGTLIWAKAPSDTALLYWYWHLLNGGEVLDPTATQVVLASPEGVEAFTWFVELYTKHQVVPNPIEVDYPAANTMWLQEQVGLFQIGPGHIQITLQQNPDLRFSTAPLPVPEGKGPAAWGLGMGMVMPTGNEYPDESWELLKYIAADPNNQIEYCLKVGPFPTLKEAASDPSIAADPYLSAYASLLPYCRPQPKSLYMAEVKQHQYEAMQEALLGAKEPAQALEDAANRLQEVLDRG